jgi:hypothetical protein
MNTIEESQVTEQEINKQMKESESPPPPQQKLTDIKITDENVSLNVLIGFLNMAQKRGAFAFEESAKILECIKCFQK